MTFISLPNGRLAEVSVTLSAKRALAHQGQQRGAVIASNVGAAIHSHLLGHGKTVRQLAGALRAQDGLLEWAASVAHRNYARW